MLLTQETFRRDFTAHALQLIRSAAGLVTDVLIGGQGHFATVPGARQPCCFSIRTALVRCNHVVKWVLESLQQESETGHMFKAEIEAAAHFDVQYQAATTVWECNPQPLFIPEGSQMVCTAPADEMVMRMDPAHLSYYTAHYALPNHAVTIKKKARTLTLVNGSVALPLPEANSLSLMPCRLTLHAYNPLTRLNVSTTTPLYDIDRIRVAYTTPDRVDMNLVHNLAMLANQVIGVRVYSDYHMVAQLLSIYMKDITVGGIFAKGSVDQSLELLSLRNVLFTDDFVFYAFR